MKRPPKPLLAPEELDFFWRGLVGGPDFIGPVAPPMFLWLRDREKQAAWRKQVSLDPKGQDDETQRWEQGQ